MTSQDIKELLKFGERISLECKEAKNEILNQYGKHILHLLTLVEVLLYLV